MLSGDSHNEKEIASKIIGVLKKDTNGGLTITELVDISKFSRSTTQVVLAKLEDAREVLIRNIGSAKVYCLAKK